MTNMGKVSGPEGHCTFMGLPVGRLDALKNEIAIIGVPTATPYASSGLHAVRAPAAIRRVMSRYAGSLDRHDFDLDGLLLPIGGRAAVDCGDLTIDVADASANRQRITDAVRRCRAHGGVPIVLGGDDSVPIPVLAAYAGEPTITIVQIDAHIDWRHEVGGETLGYSSTMRRASEMGHVGRIVQVGQRGIGSARPSDIVDARAYGVRFVSASHIQRDGPASALEAVSEGGPVFISFDIDALDPAVAPGVLTRSPGGLTYDQALAILHGIAAKAPIVGFTLVELAPDHDQSDLTALIAGRLVANAIGLLSRQGVRGA
jgi:agmatinase